MYQEQNAAALKREIATRETVYNQGGDPNNVRMQSDLQRAQASGLAKVMVNKETGEQFVSFGKGGPENTFPLRTAPKPRKVRGAALIDALRGETEPATE
jgi:hypothetical protein